MKEISTGMLSDAKSADDIAVVRVASAWRKRDSEFCMQQFQNLFMKLLIDSPVSLHRQKLFTRQDKNEFMHIKSQIAAQIFFCLVRVRFGSP